MPYLLGAAYSCLEGVGKTSLQLSEIRGLVYLELLTFVPSICLLTNPGGSFGIGEGRNGSSFGSSGTLCRNAVRELTTGEESICSGASTSMISRSSCNMIRIKNKSLMLLGTHLLVWASPALLRIRLLVVRDGLVFLRGRPGTHPDSLAFAFVEECYT